MSPTYGVVRCDGETVNVKTSWNGEFYRWRMTDGHHQYTWESRYANIHDEWVTGPNDNGFFRVYKYYEGDPRDWVIEDELPEDVSLAMRMAMIFVAVHFSSPRI